MSPEQERTPASIGRLFAALYRSKRSCCVTAILLAISLPFCSGLSILLLIPILESVGVTVGGSSASSVGRIFRDLMDALGVSPSLSSALLIFVAVSAFHSLLLWYQAGVNARLKGGFVLIQQHRLCEAFSRAHWPLFLQIRQQDIVHALSVEAERLLSGLKALLSLVSSVALTVVYTLFSFILSPGMTAIAAFSGVALAPFVIPRARAARGSGMQLTELTQRLYRDILDHLAGVKEAKSMGAESRHVCDFAKVAGAASQTRIQFETAKGAALFVFSCGTAVTVSLVMYVAIEVLNMAAAELLLLIIIYSRLTPRILKMQNDYQDLAHTLPAYANIVDLRQKCDAAAEKLEHDSPGQAFALTRDVELIDVGFRYCSESDIWALRHVNLTLAAGSVTAIVGQSGSGKSTLADLLLGLLSPEEGLVSVDGTDIHDRLSAWRQTIGYVPQETFLLHDTIKANLLWGNTDASDDEISEVMKLASIDEVIAALPDGLDTVVGERGARLSGGERQRIALARALLRKPSLLVLDEATSALDPANQTSIQTSLERLSGRLTTVIIAHQQSAIVNAQQVVVLDRGRVVQRGEIGELTRKEGDFRNLMRVDCPATISG